MHFVTDDSLREVMRVWLEQKVKDMLRGRGVGSIGGEGAGEEEGEGLEGVELLVWWKRFKHDLAKKAGALNNSARETSFLFKGSGGGSANRAARSYEAGGNRGVGGA